MKLHRLGLLALTALSGSSTFAAQLWYNGDFDARNGSNVGGFSGFDSRAYDNFNVTGAGWNVTGVYMNVLTAIPQSDIQNFNWEVRSGVGAGTGGSLLFSGASTATATATGRSGFGLSEYTVLVTGLNFNLSAGTYFLGGKIGGNGSNNNIFVSTTSGANAVGTPPGNDGNSWWDSTSFGQSWVSQTVNFGAGTWDLSMGVNGSVVPEPASMAALGMGALALLRRRKKA